MIRISFLTMRYKLLIFFLLCFSLRGLAQVKFKDIFEGNDQERVTKAENWFFYYYASPDSAVAVPQLSRLLAEAEERDDEPVALMAQYITAHYHIAVLGEDEPWYNEQYRVMEKTRSQNKLLWAIMLHRTGTTNYETKRNFAKGFEELIRAHETFKELGYDKNLRAGLMLYELAKVYYGIGNYEKCIELLKPAEHYKDTFGSYIDLQVLNTLGMAYRRLDKQDSALIYFEKTLTEATAKKDLAWIGIASINIGKYYLSKGEFDKALPYVETRYKYSRQKDSRLSEADSCEALISLAQIDIHYGNPDLAIKRLNNVKKALKPSWWGNNWSNNYDLWRDMYAQLSDAYVAKGDLKEAYLLSDLAFRYEDSLFYVKKQSNAQKISVEVEAEKQMTLLKEVEHQTMLSIQKRNFSMGVAALGTILLLTLYNRQRMKSKKEKVLFENKEQLLNSEKRRAEEQLSGYVDILQEKNKTIEGFQTEIERLKLNGGTGEPQIIQTLEKLQRTAIIIEDDWVQFKELFDKVYKGFFERLKEKYPDITQAEMRLMALTKLNIAPKDIANILGISPASVRKTGYRFLKKIDPEGTTDLIDIVKSI